jgi:hypothetical protein
VCTKERKEKEMIVNGVYKGKKREKNNWESCIQRKEIIGEVVYKEKKKEENNWEMCIQWK